MVLVSNLLIFRKRWHIYKSIVSRHEVEARSLFIAFHLEVLASRAHAMCLQVVSNDIKSIFLWHRWKWKKFMRKHNKQCSCGALSKDMSTRAFYKPDLVSKFAEEYCNISDLTRPLSDQDRIRVKNSIWSELVYRYGRQYKISGVSASSTTKPIDRNMNQFLLSGVHEASVDGLRIGTTTKLSFASGVGNIHMKIEVVCRSLIILSPRRLG
ncbi:hypothetical protein Vadar_000213 [Vaccinium darrowii]|uniref:Uncharacterized protein n=1 Tax=Vaccinium darrowii TaxID=229202 RepID=A0ACB7X6E2_9ERIC|nr:hypothetical protein Vadar_000213 [Vaccinium darrowii]